MIKYDALTFLEPFILRNGHFHFLQKLKNYFLYCF